ncbi:MAG: ATP-binding protein [Chrysiogenales bacterium]|nr:MAG: ATP-binding protein [Chrysiogenales bacterium]
MSQKKHEIDFLNSYSADTAVVPEVIDQLISDLRKSDYNRDEIDEIVLAMDEAVTNAVQETMKTYLDRYDGDDDRRDITIRYTITSDLFDATVIDHGRGLDLFNILNLTPRCGSRTYLNEIDRYASESEKSKITVRLNGKEIPLRGIGAGLKIILNFMDAVTIDLIDKKKVLSRSVTEHTDGTIFNMKRKRRYE